MENKGESDCLFADKAVSVSVAAVLTMSVELYNMNAGWYLYVSPRPPILAARSNVCGT